MAICSSSKQTTILAVATTATIVLECSRSLSTIKLRSSVGTLCVVGLWRKKGWRVVLNELTQTDNVKIASIRHQTARRATG